MLLSPNRPSDFRRIVVHQDHVLPMCPWGGPCPLAAHLRKFGRSERLLADSHEEVHNLMREKALEFLQMHNENVVERPLSFMFDFKVSQRTIPNMRARIPGRDSLGVAYLAYF